MNSTAAPATHFTDDSTIERVEDMVTAQVEDQAVVMHLANGNFYQLNRVATRIWDQLETPLALGELYARLGEIFDVAPDQCRADVTKFLTEMCDNGIIRIKQPTA